MPTNLGFNVLVNFSTDTRNYSRQYREVNKGLNTLNSLTDKVRESLTGAFNPAGLVKFNKTLIIANMSTMEGVKVSSEYVKRIGEMIDKNHQFGDSAKVFFMGNYLNKAVKAFGKLNNVMEEFVAGFKKGGDAAKNFDTNMNSLLLRNSKDFYTLNSSLSEFENNLESFDPKRAGRIVDLMSQLARTDLNPKQISLYAKEIDALVAKQSGLNKLKSSLDDFRKSTLAKIASAVGIGNIAGDLLKTQDNVYKTVARMGMATSTGLNKMEVGSIEYTKQFRKTARDFMDTAGNVASTTKIRYTEAAEAMRELAEQRVVNPSNIKELGELSKTTIYMSQAFGITSGEAAGFASDLMKIGGKGAKDVRNAADAIADLQANFGVTAGEAREVTAQVGKMIRGMRSYGRTVNDVGKMTREVGKLQYAFKKVGMEASDANAMIDQLTNPDNIDQIATQAALAGVSVADAMQAAATNDTKYLADMSLKAAQNINKMGAGMNATTGWIATSALGNIAGISKEVRGSAAGISKAYNESTTKTANIEEAAAASRQSLLEQGQIAWAEIANTISKTLVPAMEAITPVIQDLVKGFKGISDFFTKLGPIGQAFFGLFLLDLLSMGKITGLVFGGFGKLFKETMSGGVKEAGGFFGYFKNNFQKLKAFITKQPLDITGGVKAPRPGDIVNDLKRGPRFPKNVGETVGPRFGKKIGGMAQRNAAKAAEEAAALEAKAAGNVAKSAEGAAGKVGKFASSVQGMGKELLMAGAGVALMAAGIALIVLSLIKLIKTIDRLKSPWSALFGVAALGAVIAGIALLGIIAKKSGKSMVEFGIGVALIGVGIGIILGFVILLLKTIDNLHDKVGTLIGAGIMLALVFGGIGLAAKLGSKSVKEFGMGIIMVGAGIALIIGSLALLARNMKNLTAGQMVGLGAMLTLVIGGIILLAIVVKKSAKSMLMFGAGMGMIGASIALIITSISLLAKTMRSMTGTQMLGMALVLGIVIGGMILLSAVAKKSSKDMIMFGVGMALIAGSIALIVISIIMLSNAMKEMTFKSAAGMAIVLAVVIGGMMGLSAVAKVGAKSMVLFGVGMLMIGAGIALVIASIALLAKTMSGLSTGAGWAMGVMLAVIVGGMIAMAAIAKSSSAQMLVFGAGIALIGVGISAILLSLTVLVKTLDGLNNMWKTLAGAGALIILLMVGIGLAAKAGGVELLAFGAGIALIGLGVSAVILSFAMLLNAINGFSASWDTIIKVGAIFLVVAAALALGIFLIGNAATAVAPGLLALSVTFLSVGAAVLMIGAGITMIGLGFKMIGDAVVNMGKNFNQALLGFAAITIGLVGLAIGIGAFIGMMILVAPGLAIVSANFLGFGIALAVAAGSILLAASGLLLLQLAMAGLSKISGKSLDGFITAVGVLWTVTGQLALMAIPMAAAGIGSALLAVGFLSLAVAALAVGHGIRVAVDSLTGLIKSTKDMKGGLRDAAVEIKGFLAELNKGSEIKDFIKSFQGVDEAATSIGVIIGSISKLYEAASKMGPGAFDGLDKSLGVLTSSLKDAVGAIGGATFKQLAGLALAFKGMGEGINATAEGLGKFIKTVEGVKNLESYVEPLKNLLGAVFSSMGGLVTQLSETGPLASAGVGNAFKGIGEGMGPMLTGISQFISNLKILEDDDISKKIAGNMQLVMTAAFTAIGTLTDSLRGMNAKSMTAFKDFAEGLQNVLASISQLQSSVGDGKFALAVGLLKDNLGSLTITFEALTTAMGPDAKVVGEAFKSFGAGLKDTVGAIVSFAEAYDKIAKINFDTMATDIGKLAPIIGSFNSQLLGPDGKTAVDMKAVGDSMKATGDGVISLTTALNGLSTMTNLSASIAKFKENLTALLGVVKGTDASTKSFSDFATSITTFGTNMDAVEKSTGSFLKNIQDISVIVKDGGFSSGLGIFTSFAKALTDIGTAAKGMGGDIGTIKSLTTVFTEFDAKMNKGSGDAANAFSSYANSISGMANGLKTLVGMQKDLKGGVISPEIQQQFKDLGTSIASFSNSLKGKTKEQMETVGVAMKSVGEGITSLVNALKLLDGSTKDVGTIQKSFNDFAEALKSVIATASSLGTNLNGLNTFISSLERLPAALGNFNKAFTGGGLNNLQALQMLIFDLSQYGDQAAKSMNAIADAFSRIKPNATLGSFMDGIFGGKPKVENTTTSTNANTNNNNISVIGPDKQIFDQINKNTSTISDTTKAIKGDTGSINANIKTLVDYFTKNPQAQQVAAAKSGRVSGDPLNVGPAPAHP